MAFPEGIRVPAGLSAAGFALRPISLDDVERDFAAVVESRDDLRLWEQSGWPSDDFTVDDNRVDVAALVERHAARRAFTFTVTDPGDRECLGCVYVFPQDATFLAKADRRQIGRLSWEDLDAAVYFWVRTSRRREGLDAEVLGALRPWFRDAWHLPETAYVAHESFGVQQTLFAATGLLPAFEIREPDKPGVFVAHL